MSAFLSSADIVELTGRKMKSKQIEVLRQRGLLFFVNAVGKPVVPVAAVEGKKVAPQKKQWEMPE